ncbi:hypothetical protein BDV33DRAFT_170868 [Aspergillus novoparasiticus]|uniref:DUF3074 domain-containing protein n=1 Tax=Aspergillus novoparasiticus TaxID=986946 RepID=A0A5N6EUC5_9EURO|nr:hypothetical protein BDV33DRAFT_170868 [Aspergillus novoparasiticus]
MAGRSPARLLFTLATPPLLVGYGAHVWLNSLEARYPPIAPDRSSTELLRTPANSTTQHVPHIDIYAARIRLRDLQARTNHPTEKPTKQDLNIAWAQSLLNCSILRLEAKVIGLFSKGKFNPGDLGTTPAGFSPDPETGAPRELLNGAMTVIRQPVGNEPLLVKWEIPDGPRRFFETIARWGYPWRLMTGGRHEMSVEGPFDGEGDEEGLGPFVEVRFASAHTYEIVPEEGGLLQQKTIPKWVGRLHRGYARFLLDTAVKELVEGTE